MIWAKGNPGVQIVTHGDISSRIQVVGVKLGIVDITIRVFASASGAFNYRLAPKFKQFGVADYLHLHAVNSKTHCCLCLLNLSKAAS